MKQNSAAAASSCRAGKSQQFCESSIRLWFASQANSKLYVPCVRVNAVVEPIGVATALSNSAKTNLRQHRLVKFVPIVKIVQVHRIFECGSVVRDVACVENALACFVIVIVTAHRRIVLIDGLSS
jgi:hypothetical protein